LYWYMKKAATEPQLHASRPDIQDYIAIGFIPAENEMIGTCLVQAYAYDDFVMGSFAQALGLGSDAAMFFNRSQNYRNHWSPADQFFCPRDRNGTFLCDSWTLNVFSKSYVEGDAWHYRFNAEHDVPGLISLFGGAQPFMDALDTFQMRSFLNPSTILPNAYFWAGNEEDLHTPYLFNWIGRPDKTQFYMRRNLRERYLNQDDGIPGNDDYGAMSAWWIWGSLGFYPISGTTRFAIGSPAIPNAVIQRPQGALTVQAYNWTESTWYVTKCAVNGVVRNRNSYFLDWTEIKGKALVEFWMSEYPSR